MIRCLLVGDDVLLRPLSRSASDRRNAFARQFSRKLLGYALGRAVQLSDEPLLDTLAAVDYPIGSVVELIVKSRQFREIRGRDTAPEE